MVQGFATDRCCQLCANESLRVTLSHIRFREWMKIRGSTGKVRYAGLVCKFCSTRGNVASTDNCLFCSFHRSGQGEMKVKQGIGLIVFLSSLFVQYNFSIL